VKQSELRQNVRQVWEISIANPASAAAANVPISAACTNGIDLRNTLRIIAPGWPTANTDSA
jgi:hypothetical protein